VRTPAKFEALANIARQVVTRARVDSYAARRGWYDIDPRDPKEYRRAEDHWNDLCDAEQWKYPGIAREIYWDAVGQAPHRDATNNSWWAYALQGAPTSPLVNKLRAIPYAPPYLQHSA
jgi:hypothetical protein